ncbi:MAG: hypothetical protein IPF66_17355 [Holophagales bacterium]|nr:hypothetical protein [Holophagales bacterium]
MSLTGLDSPSGVVADQHFIRRQRQNRLLSVIPENPTSSASASTRRPRSGSARTARLRSSANGVMVFDAKGGRFPQARDTGQDLLGVHA